MKRKKSEVAGGGSCWLGAGLVQVCQLVTLLLCIASP